MLGVARVSRFLKWPRIEYGPVSSDRSGTYWVMISMQRQKWFPKRTATIVVAAVAALAAAGTALAGEPETPGDAGHGKKPGFYETYHGHQIMGWGSGDAACAYIDGKRLVVYPAPDGNYTSAVQGFKPERSLKAITKASVKQLGDMKLAATAEPNPKCPEFETPA
ncbi:hypothetical protein MB27_23215 [Actinoplanes utahensis]|uniref:Tyrosinase co-factor MelC1 n=2 Tax=Actinoplanes utahensis TaxID=1869 RepID=A0A0A6UJX7_ACTUT|nr:hypothetical protein MB27_23215 [Actinoplanes utahensis]